MVMVLKLLKSEAKIRIFISRGFTFCTDVIIKNELIDFSEEKLMIMFLDIIK